MKSTLHCDVMKFYYAFLERKITFILFYAILSDAYLRVDKNRKEDRGAFWGGDGLRSFPQNFHCNPPPKVEKGENWQKIVF